MQIKNILFKHQLINNNNNNKKLCNINYINQITNQESYNPHLYAIETRAQARKRQEQQQKQA